MEKSTSNPARGTLRQRVGLTVVLLAVLLAYSNSFQNEFHFDDFHTIVDNPAIRSLKNIPRFFTDATAFSVLPANRTYRPVVSTSLAVDYWLGRGYGPLWFHVSTFLLYLLQVWLLYALYRLLLDKIRPGSVNEWLALFGAAWFGLHPAMAETVNYVIQRGDLYCTLGCVAALYLFAHSPERRKFCVYLVPFSLALLSKPPAAVFPVLLVMYCYFFEAAGEAPGLRLWKGVKAAVPAIAVTLALLALQSAMTPKTFAPSMINPWDYRLAQPYVWARYFAEFFLPLHLNVDTDLTPFSTLNPQALLGLVFLAALLAGIWFTARRRVLYPVAFGLLWFVVTQLPTSLYPLSEVENDHRMFFSFAGLMLAAVWAAWLLLEQMELPEKLRPLLVAAAVLVLAAYGYGAHVRNAVWRTEDTLWADDAVKSPHNGRGLMIYGLTQMNHGDFVKALQTFTQALLYTPNYATLEINLGVVKGILADQGNLALGGDAERHFQRAVALSPGDDAPYAYYGRWLGQHQRFPEAIAQLQLAIALDPVRPFNHDVLIDTETRAGDVEGTKRAAIATLKLIPDDGPALTALAHPEGIIPGQGAAYWINLSLTQSRQGLNEAAIASAKRALAIDPNDADAYVNIGAGYGAMGQWDLAIENETQALRLKPDFQLAKNNIAWYAQQKAAGKAAATGTGSVDALINQSMQLSQAGQYEAGIAAAQKALRIDPGAAIAWNNIAAANEALHRWDKAIDAAQKAIALRPDFQLARNNLAWSVAQKKAGVK